MAPPHRFSCVVSVIHQHNTLNHSELQQSISFTFQPTDFLFLTRYNLSHMEQWLRDHKLQDTNVQQALDPIIQASQLLQARKTDTDVDSVCEMCSKLTTSQVATPVVYMCLLLLKCFKYIWSSLWKTITSQWMKKVCLFNEMTYFDQMDFFLDHQLRVFTSSI